MRTISVSGGRVANVDDDLYDELAQFTWTSQVHRNRRGEISLIYAWRWTSAKCGPKKPIYMHRQIVGVMDPRLKVDHWDHNGLNNRLANLRICAHGQNLGNSRLPVDNTSGYKGVTWYVPTGKWCVQIGGVKLGYFVDIKDAAEAYRRAAKERYGEFACFDSVGTALEVTR